MIVQTVNFCVVMQSVNLFSCDENTVNFCQVIGSRSLCEGTVDLFRVCLVTVQSDLFVELYLW